MVLAVSGGPAAAAVDVSGRWMISYTEASFGDLGARSVTLSQSGPTLTVSETAFYASGTIDPVTGALGLSGPPGCGGIQPSLLQAEVAPDGASFTGTFSERRAATPFSCFALSGTVAGVRLPDTCGNGVVDDGEFCDQGLEGECCNEFCQPRPTTWPCNAPSTAACFARARCDGAGSCAQLPKAAGTQCRARLHDCDTPELCDGVSLACPPESTGTEPDVDGDGTLDTCDECVGHPLEKVRLAFGRLGGDQSDDFVSLRARVRLPAGDTLPLPPPTSRFRRFDVYDATGALVVSDGARPFASADLWHQKGSRWLFVDELPFAHIVPTRVTMSPVKGDPSVWDVVFKVPSAKLVQSAPVPPFALDVILDSDPFGDGTNRCGRLEFGPANGRPPRCSARGRSGVIRCR